MDNKPPSNAFKFLLRTTFILSAAVLAGLALIPKLRDYVYREASYAVVAQPVFGTAKDSVELTTRAVSFVHQQLYPGGGPVIDTDSWTHLVRGIGWCDQQDWTVGTLIALKRLHSRLVMLHTDPKVSGHVILEVFLEGDWRMVDPLSGLWFIRPDKTLATRGDFQRDLSLLKANPVINRLNLPARQRIIDQYQALFPLRSEPTVWGSILESREKNQAKALLSRVIYAAWSALGSGWANAWQDVYLAVSRPPPELAQDMTMRATRDVSSEPNPAVRPEVRAYFKARNYHLYRRFDKAAEAYRQVIRINPGSGLAEKSQAWLGLAQLQAGHSAEAIATLEGFLKERPDSGWTARVQDWLSVAYNQVGDVQRAESLAGLASNDPYVPTGWRAAYKQPPLR